MKPVLLLMTALVTASFVPTGVAGPLEDVCIELKEIVGEPCEHCDGQASSGWTTEVWVCVFGAPCADSTAETEAERFFECARASMNSNSGQPSGPTLP